MKKNILAFTIAAGALLTGSLTMAETRTVFKAGGAFDTSTAKFNTGGGFSAVGKMQKITNYGLGYTLAALVRGDCMGKDGEDDKKDDSNDPKNGYYSHFASPHGLAMLSDIG